MLDKKYDPSYARQLYPKEPKIKPDPTHRTWRVDYRLTYDGGEEIFSKYYRTCFGALWSAFWYIHLRSWGGDAVLVNQNYEHLFEFDQIDGIGQKRRMEKEMKGN